MQIKAIPDSTQIVKVMPLNYTADSAMPAKGLSVKAGPDMITAEKAMPNKTAPDHYKPFKFIPLEFNGEPPTLDESNIGMWKAQMLVYFRGDNPHLFRYIRGFARPHERDAVAFRHKRNVVHKLKTSGCIPPEYWVDDEPYRAFLRVQVINSRPNDNSLWMHAQRWFQLDCLAISTKGHNTLRSYLNFLIKTKERIIKEDINIVTEVALFNSALEGIREEYPCWHHNLKRIVEENRIQDEDLCIFLDRQAAIEEHFLQSCKGRHIMNERHPCKHCRLCSACGRQHFSYEPPGSMAFKLVQRRNWFGKCWQWSPAQDRAVRTLEGHGIDPYEFFAQRDKWGQALWGWLAGFEAEYAPWPLFVPEVHGTQALPWFDDVMRKAHARRWDMSADLAALGLPYKESGVTML
jgi:hypothetical protein